MGIDSKNKGELHEEKDLEQSIPAIEIPGCKNLESVNSQYYLCTPCSITLDLMETDEGGCVDVRGICQS